MNSIMQMMPELRRHQENAQKLMQLRDQLVGLGVPAELRDNDSTLMVPRPEPGLPLWVVIEYAGTFYAWDDNRQRHPVFDAQGAALVLVAAIGDRR
ncbi:hypothetical protein [Nonomuraea sp. NPDC050783]|uniref:hypothetical protein n=1 Tax=Nonomuraea sp. NPDC050783 TaxID=3154634 RepID=UPI003467636F